MYLFIYNTYHSWNAGDPLDGCRSLFPLPPPLVSVRFAVGELRLEGTPGALLGYGFVGNRERHSGRDRFQLVVAVGSPNQSRDG